ncbi:MAG TPA: oxygenase MpaB family protein [Mycobacteriales bacterium]|nr:oxygenase MpaB family protein [Mycobacteriales bacterium]
MSGRPTWYPPLPTRRERMLGDVAGRAAGLGAPLYGGSVLKVLGAVTEAPKTNDALDVAGDPGWFGPDSVIWRVHADPSAFVAGMSAFIVQTLQPRAMAGVYDHSDFKNDFFGRTRRTGHYVLGVTYESTPAAERWVRIVRAVHEKVVGETPDGRPYSANEPRLLEWVHITQYQALASAYQRFSRDPLTLEELDRYVAETAKVGAALGVPNPPRTWAELDDAFQDFRTELCVGEQAATGINALRNLPGLHPAVRPAWNAVWAGAVAVMPNVARKLTLLPAPHERELIACRALIGALRAVRGEPTQLTRAKERIARGVREQAA